MIKIFLCAMAMLTVWANNAHAQSFEFEKISDLSAMTSYIQSNLPLGTSRENMQKTFVQEGGATLIAHPQNSLLEKYIYDINLCSWYVWRWNISALYDQSGKLQQAYMNGEHVFAAGPQIKSFAKKENKDGKMSITKVMTPRPAASKGESQLASIVYDEDGDLKTLEDQELMGAGPSRVDPLNMGKMHVYKINSIWGSIFDHDKAKSIASYQGNCEAVDKAMEQAKASASGRKSP